MSEFNIVGAVISFITGGGLVTGVIALRKDKRDSRQTDLDYTKQFREIAIEVVEDTRTEIGVMVTKIENLESRVAELETSVRIKDRIIGLLVEYIGRLRDVLDVLKPPHPLPEVPDELKDYIK